MTDRIALQNLAKARSAGSHYDEKLTKPELLGDNDPIIAEFRAADPETGKPAGKFSQAALDALISLQGAARGELSRSVERLLPGLIEEARANLWTAPGGGDPGDSRVLDLPAKDGHSVFLTTQGGFAVDAEGTAPANHEALGKALFSAGEWVQAGFGGSDNLFSQLDNAGKNAVLEQFEGVTTADLASLEPAQVNQLLGNIAGLGVELAKSVEITRHASPASEERAVIDRAWKLIDGVLNDSRVSPLIQRQLVGYLTNADSFTSKLTTPQKKALAAKDEALNPKAPFDYDQWDADNKSTISVAHIAGGGEGFLYGITKWLTEKGLGSTNYNDRKNKFTITSGSNDDDHADRTLSVTVPANDPMNKWGRDMTIEIELSAFHNNMLEGLGRADVDITGYDGHSGFGRNTLRSMDRAPKQNGPKLFYRFVCAGVDAENAIAQHAPEAYANSYTTQDSGYFRKTSGGPGGMKYAYEAEGWQALKAMIRGVLGKEDHKGIQAEMKQHAHWRFNHSPGNDNNFVGPGDKRRGGSGDWDSDGIPNMYDVMPTVNTFDVAASVANEFDLKLPSVSAAQINGRRAFQAVQFVDTATNYTTLLKKFNLNRAINPHPQGIFFDGASDPNTYVKFSEQDGKMFVQFNSALSDMTMESLRAVLYYETSKYLLTKNNHPSSRNQADLVAASLIFAGSSLSFDMSFRDAAVFDGLKKLYNIPSDVSWRDFSSALRGAENRHNYSGDSTAVRAITDKYAEQLGRDGVGKPAVAVHE